MSADVRTGRAKCRGEQIGLVSLERVKQGCRTRELVGPNTKYTIDVAASSLTTYSERASRWFDLGEATRLLNATSIIET